MHYFLVLINCRSLSRPPYGTANRPRVKITGNGILTLRLPPMSISSVSHEYEDVHTNRNRLEYRMRCGALTSRSDKVVGLLDSRELKADPLKRVHDNKVRLIENLHSAELPMLNNGATPRILKKFERTKATLIDIHCGAPHFGSPKQRNLDGKVVSPRLPPDREVCVDARSELNDQTRNP